MTKYDKMIAKVLSGRSDENINFDDLRLLLDRLGFYERVRGSHHIFVQAGIENMINLQRDGKFAKPYQVRQVRTVISTYGLTAEEK